MTVSPGLSFTGSSAVRVCSWSIMVVPNIGIYGGERENTGETVQ